MMTDTEQREVVVRGVAIAVCSVAATVTLPALSFVQDYKRAEADYREMAMRLATLEDGGAVVRSAEHAPAVLDSSWMRTVEYSIKRDPESSLSRFAMRDRDGAALESLLTFRPEQLQRAENIQSETHCLAQAVYYESAREPLEGQLAVAEVVNNRTKDHRYPATACDVVFQGSTRTTGCQFTFTCDGALGIAPRGEDWERAKRIATHVMMGLNETRTFGATHYHATYVDPIWNQGLIKTEHIGLHVFYRFPRGAEWAKVRQDFSRGTKDQVIAVSADALTLEDLEAAALARDIENELFEPDMVASANDDMMIEASAAPDNGTPRVLVTVAAPRSSTARIDDQAAADTMATRAGSM